MQKYLTKSQTKMSRSEARIRKFVFVGKATAMATSQFEGDVSLVYRCCMVMLG